MADPKNPTVTKQSTAAASGAPAAAPQGAEPAAQGQPPAPAATAAPAPAAGQAAPAAAPAPAPAAPQVRDATMQAIVQNLPKAETYTITNDGARAVSFRVPGGIETVHPRSERVLSLREALTDEKIKEYADANVQISKSSGEPENKLVDRATRAGATPAKDPAETGGLVPRSAVSELGGVNRADGDTTTTTKPTEQQLGAKA